MKVTELISLLYKCPMDADVKVGLTDEYEYTNDAIDEVLEVSGKTADTVTVYLLHG